MSDQPNAGAATEDGSAYPNVVENPLQYMPAGQPLTNMLGLPGAQVPNVAASPTATYDWGNYNAALQGQNALAQALWNRQQGNAPSVAQNQLAMAQGQNMQSANSVAASAQGGALAHILAQRQAQQQGAGMNTSSALQTALLRAQEQQQSEAMLGQLYGQQAQQANQQQLGVGQQQVDVYGQREKANELNAAAEEKKNQGGLGAVGGIIGGIFGG